MFRVQYLCHLFFMDPITSEAWDGALYPTLILICALCRQLSCYNSIQLHIIFSSVTSKNLFQVDDKLPDITTIFMCPSVTKTLRYKKQLLTDPRVILVKDHNAYLRIKIWEDQEIDYVTAHGRIARYYQKPTRRCVKNNMEMLRRDSELCTELTREHENSLVGTGGTKESNANVLQRLQQAAELKGRK